MRRTSERNSGHKAPPHKPPKWRTYCPECAPAVASDPTSAPFVPVSGAKLPKQVRCKNGHAWTPVRG